MWRLLSDSDFDALSGPVDSEVFYLRTTVMFRCPASDHLWIFWNGIDKAPTLYTPTATRWREA